LVVVVGGGWWRLNESVRHNTTDTEFAEVRDLKKMSVKIVFFSSENCLTPPPVGS
jgi:hypothetical protein